MIAPPLALAAPLALQAALMLADELHFHRARGLARWERVGHPLDTMTVLACIAWAIFVPPSPRALAMYAALAGASCLFVTKDEPIHARRCAPGEHWLHAVLFVLHPICLGAIALLWTSGDADAARVVRAQACLTLAFGAYQALYWNLPWPRRAPRPR